MTQRRHCSRVSVLVLAAGLVTSCEEEPASSYFGTAPPESPAVEVQRPQTDSACPAYYYYNFNSERMADSEYCARILARCMGPNGRPRDNCI